MRRTFLSRSEYDSLLPMSADLLGMFLAADRQWSLLGVTVTFASEEALREFEAAVAVGFGR